MACRKDPAQVGAAHLRKGRGRGPAPIGCRRHGAGPEARSASQGRCLRRSLREWGGVGLRFLSGCVSLRRRLPQRRSRKRYGWTLELPWLRSGTSFPPARFCLSPPRSPEAEAPSLGGTARPRSRTRKQRCLPPPPWSPRRRPSLRRT